MRVTQIISNLQQIPRRHHAYLQNLDRDDHRKYYNERKIIREPDLIFRTMFESIDGYNIDQTAGGSTTVIESGLQVIPANAVDAYVDIRRVDTYSYAPHSWEKPRRLAASILTNTRTNVEAYLVIGGYGTQEGFGFRINNEHIYGYLGDGTTGYLSDFGIYNHVAPHTIEAMLIPKNKVKYYLDGVYQGYISALSLTGNTLADRYFHLYFQTLIAAIIVFNIGDYRFIQYPRDLDEYDLQDEGG